MKRLLFSLLVGLTVFGTVLGLAASLTVTSDGIGAGATASGITVCDSTPELSYTVDTDVPPDLANVVVTVDAACDTAAVSVTIGTTTVSGTIATTSATLDFSAANIDPASITDATVTLVGP